MSLNLFLLRHGKAVDVAHTDFDRPLAPKGQEQAKQKGILLQQLEPISFVLCSAAIRTKETLQYLSMNIPSSSIAFQKELYLASPEVILKSLQQINHSKSVLVIGHNPGLHQLAYDLCAQHSSNKTIDEQALGKSFPTCALAHYHFSCKNWFDIDFHHGKLISYYL